MAPRPDDGQAPATVAGAVRAAVARCVPNARRGQAGLRARRSWPLRLPVAWRQWRPPWTRASSDPHRPTVAGAAAAWGAPWRRAVPHSRFTCCARQQTPASRSVAPASAMKSRRADLTRRVRSV